MNLITNIKNSYLLTGLTEVLKTVMPAGYNPTVIHVSQWHEFIARPCSVGIFVFSPGEARLCPEYFNPLSQQHLSIGIVPDNHNIDEYAVPRCMSGMLIINKSIPVATLQKQLRRALCSSARHESIPADGLRCRENKLTGRQLVFARYYWSGYSASKMADIRNRSKKTIYSHRNNLMKRFSLRSRQELYQFLHCANQRGLLNISPGRAPGCPGVQDEKLICDTDCLSGETAVKTSTD